MNIRRTALSSIAAALILIGGFAAVSTDGARAQEATPAPLGFALAPGVTAEDVAPPVGSPTLARLQFAAGASYQASDGSDPSIALVYGESGVLTLTVAGPVTVFRADAAGKPGDAIAAVTAFDLHPGDYVVAPGKTAALIANKGAAPATLLVASIAPPMAGKAATPTS